MYIYLHLHVSESHHFVYEVEKIRKQNKTQQLIREPYAPAVTRRRWETGIGLI